jgi:hypothetical protein
MRKAIQGYVLQSLSISLILIIAYYLFGVYGFPQFYTKVVYFVIGAIFLINCAFHAFLVRTATSKGSAFIRYYLASTMFRLLIYIVIILVMIFLAVPLLKVILVSFLFFYIVYTSHEVFSMLQFLKKNSTHDAKSK